MSLVKSNGEPGEHIFDLLDRAMRALRDDFQARLPDPEAGFELRASHRRLLSMVPEEGIRVSDLAIRAGMTAQALGEFARKLQTQGLLAFGRDPADGRVRILTLTPQGRRVEREGDAAIRAMEADLRERLGGEEWQGLRSALVRLGALGGDPRG